MSLKKLKPLNKQNTIDGLTLANLCLIHILNDYLPLILKLRRLLVMSIFMIIILFALIFFADFSLKAYEICYRSTCIYSLGIYPHQARLLSCFEANAITTLLPNIRAN